MVALSPSIYMKNTQNLIINSKISNFFLNAFYKLNIGDFSNIYFLNNLKAIFSKYFPSFILKFLEKFNL